MIYLSDILKLLSLTKIISVYDEFNKLLFRGRVSALKFDLENTYLRSCPVTGVKIDFYIGIIIVVSYY